MPCLLPNCPKLNGYSTSNLTCIQSKPVPLSAHLDYSGEINFLLIYKFKRRKITFPYVKQLYFLSQTGKWMGTSPHMPPIEHQRAPYTHHILIPT